MALSQSPKTLLIRVGSALTAVLFVFLLYYFFELNGLRFLCYFAVVFGARELVRLLFPEGCRLLLKASFLIGLLAIFSLSSQLPEYSGLVVASISILFCCLAILQEKYFKDLDSLSVFMGKSLLGFLYLGLAPSFAFRLLNFPKGLAWFGAFLLIVFAGDTFAFAFGLLFGKHKLMPAVSPKKTVEGSIGGLLGSILFALLLSRWLEPAPWIYFALMGACVGVVAQLGDLFESILKRVANRKDSGSMMPGHGGVLDRLDGIFFAAPVMFFFVQLIERNLI